MMADVLAQRSELREEFDILVELTMADAQRFARMLCRGDTVQADDLYMEAWLTALKKFPLLVGINQYQFLEYFRRSIKFRFLKSKHSQLRSLDADWDDQDHTPNPLPALRSEEESEYVEPELSTAMASALSELSPRERKAFSLFADGVNAVTAAEMMSLGEEDYLAWVDQIRRQLQAYLEAAQAVDTIIEAWLNQSQLVARSGMSWYRIKRHLPQLAIEGLIPSPRLNASGWSCLHYPSSMAARLRQLEQPLQAAGIWLTAKEMACAIGRPQDWVERRLGPYRHLAENRQDNRGRSSLHYPPVVLAALRRAHEEALAVPPAGNWLTASGLAKALGKSSAWLAPRIGAYAHLAEDRLDSMGRIMPHYPPIVFEALGGNPALLPVAPVYTPKPRTQGQYTVAAMARELDRSEGWVSRGLEPFLHLAISLQAPNWQWLPHYPEFVLEELREQASVPKRWPTWFSDVKPAGDWLTIRRMAELLGRDRPWVIGRLEPFEHLAEWRWVHRSGEQKCYPPIVLAALEQLSLTQAALPPVGDWYTRRMIAIELGRDGHWVEQRIHAYALMKENRIDPWGRIVECYPPSVLEILREESEAELALPPLVDWYTGFAIALAIGRHHSWVSARIGPFEHLGERRLSALTQPVMAYPEEVKTAMERLSEEEAARPRAESWLNVFGIMRAVGRSYHWVTARIAPFEYLAEPRVDDRNNTRNYYPPMVVEALLLQSEDERARQEDLLYYWRQPFDESDQLTEPVS